MDECYRVGALKQGGSRPIKVMFNSSDAATRMLKHSASLRSVAPYSKVFLIPDRTPEERTERRKLIGEMKDKITKEPERYHFIRNGAVCSREKDSSTPQPTAGTRTVSSEGPSASPVSAPEVQAEASSRSSANLSGFQSSLLVARRIQDQRKRVGR